MFSSLLLITIEMECHLASGNVCVYSVVEVIFDYPREVHVCYVNLLDLVKDRIKWQLLLIAAMSE